MAEPLLAERLYTPEELEAMPDASNYELLDGVLTERTVSNEAARVAFKMGGILADFIESHDLGEGYNSDVGLKLWPDRPRHFRRPDIAFLSRDRLSEEALVGGWLAIAPDLIVEVVSPNDLAREVEVKVREYLDAGVTLIWVVYTEPKSVHVIRRHESSRLTEDDTLSGEDVLPGFECNVADLYPKTALPSQ